MDPQATPTPPPGFSPDTQAAPPPPAGFQPDYENYYTKDAIYGRAFDRNKGYAKPGPYTTELPPAEEQKFRNWLKANPSLPPGFDPNDKISDYDMRGFYKALKRGDQRALATVNPYDKRIHLPDIWKTPYHHSFSKESIYATPDAPHWVGNRFLVDKNNKILWDDGASEHRNDRMPGATYPEDSYSPKERAEATSGQMVGLDKDKLTDMLQPFLGETGAAAASDAVENVMNAAPYVFMASGLSKAGEGAPQFTAEGIRRVTPKPVGWDTSVPLFNTEDLYGPSGAPQYRGPQEPPIPEEPAPQTPVATQGLIEGPKGPPARPETPVAAARPETAITPARPETPIPGRSPVQTALATPPEQTIPEPAVPVQPSEPVQAPIPAPKATEPVISGRSAITRLSTQPAAPPPEMIGDMPIEQGDRDFAALIKQGAVKDADLAKFISKPKKAEPIIMQARRLYAESNGEINPVDLGKRLGINKRVATTLVQGLDKLAADQEKKLTLTAPTETTEITPAGEETAAAPSQAELEAAGQTSMFGPAPAAPKPQAPTLAPPPGFAPAPDAVRYIPEQFAGNAPMPFSKTNVFDVPTSKIKVAPEHFQYKLGGNEQGAGLSLTGARAYDPDFAGNLTLWHDAKGEIGPPGEFYVVNGHQRLALAVRDNAPSVRAQVYDSGTNLEGAARHSVSKEEARARGALINFSEGRGTSIDAATYVRNAGLKAEDLADMNLDLTEKRVSEAMELSKLSNPIWHEVAIGRLKPDLGAVIGRELGDNEPLQIGVLKMLNRMHEKGESVSDQRLEDLITAQKISGVYSEEQTDLFGQREMRKSLSEEFADLWAQARKKYGEGKLHAGVIKHQQELEQGATKIDVETAKKIAARKQELATTFQNLHKIGGTKTVEVTREYAAKLAAEPKMRNKIYGMYLKALEPALDEDAVNLRLKAGEMKVKQPELTPPVKERPPKFQAPRTGANDVTSGNVTVFDARPIDTSFQRDATARAMMMTPERATIAEYNSLRQFLKGDYVKEHGATESELKRLDELKAQVKEIRAKQRESE